MSIKEEERNIRQDSIFSQSATACSTDCGGEKREDTNVRDFQKCIDRHLVLRQGKAQTSHTREGNKTAEEDVIIKAERLVNVSVKLQ